MVGALRALVVVVMTAEAASWPCWQNQAEAAPE